MTEKNYTVRQLLKTPSFIEWATGESEGRKAQQWNEWVEDSEENRRIAIQAQKRITGIRFTNPQCPDKKAEWARIRADIEGKSLALKSSKSASKSKRFPYILKIAAVLLIGAFIGVGISSYLYEPIQKIDNKITFEKVRTDYDEKKTINLADGSKIILGANSELSYKSNWLKQSVKQVELRGEAYFSIAPQKQKDINQPKFIVQTNDGSASVWGTRFTVDTYETGTKVVLDEGEVQVEVDNVKGEKVNMEPGDMATFSKSQPHVSIEKVDPTVYTSWTTQELYFDNTPFSVLVNRIEQTYGVSVKVEDSQILNTRLSGKIDFISLSGVLEGASKIMEVDIKRSGRDVIIHNNN